MTDCVELGMINEYQISNAAPYAISKGALNVMVSKLHASYADQGIVFMGICPGLVDTAEGSSPQCSC
jgi:NAD(P)-dependent dehydrogenase (short-subunit alcohol dehydrogenase family)